MINHKAVAFFVYLLNTHASRTLDDSPTHILLPGTVQLLEEW